MSGRYTKFPSRCSQRILNRLPGFTKVSGLLKYQEFEKGLRKWERLFFLSAQGSSGHAESFYLEMGPKPMKGFWRCLFGGARNCMQSLRTLRPVTRCVSGVADGLRRPITPERMPLKSSIWPRLCRHRSILHLVHTTPTVGFIICLAVGFH